MQIELNEIEMIVLNRIDQLYYDGMYHDLYEKRGTEFPLDSDDEELMRSAIENIILKINAEFQDSCWVKEDHQ